MKAMRILIRVVTILALLTAAFAEDLPEGDTGIAARYPGDAGIEKDASIITVENFEADSIDTLLKGWESTKGREIMSFSDDLPAGSGGKQSLLMTHTGGEGTGGHLYKRLQPGFDRVFARFYVKFDPECYPIHHFGTHLGGFNPSTPWPQGGAGDRPDGRKRFTTGVEPYGESWKWGFYTYWQGMHRHGGGKYWGTPFLLKDESPPVERGKWICVEMMMKMNDPVSASNGEQAFWIDGKLWRAGGQIVSHVGPGFPKGKWAGGWWQPDPETDESFEGFQWRSTPELKVNYLWTYLYTTRAPKGHVSRVWFDDIVVARDYIGPIRKAN